MTTWTIVLPYSKPPLSLNDRRVWQAKWRADQAVKTTVWLMLRPQHIPPLARCSVQLEYQPRDDRRRDTDNLLGTGKVIYDSVVQAGIVPDDTPQYMAKPEPRILPKGPAFNAQGHRMRLVIEEIG